MEVTGEQEAYHEICCYTLTHGHPSFIHQHVVDAFGAPFSGETEKPIRLVFALVGVYLHVVQGIDGKQVQAAHIELARNTKAWPALELPVERGETTAKTVLATDAGPERDQLIHGWCVDVWEAFASNRSQVEGLLKRHSIH